MTRKPCCVFVFPSFLTLLFMFEAGAVQKCTGRFCRWGWEQEAARFCGEENLGCAKVNYSNSKSPVECWFHSENRPPLEYSREMLHSPMLDIDLPDWVLDKLVLTVLLPKAARPGDPWDPFQPAILWFHEGSDWRQVLDSGNGLKGTLLGNIFNTKTLAHEQYCTNAWFVHFLLNLSPDLKKIKTQKRCYHRNINCKTPSFE